MNTAFAAAHQPVEVLDPTRIDQLTWKSVPGCPGVRATVLRDSDDTHDALIAYEPGAKTPGHPHAGVAHHIWVVSGAASVARQRAVAGSYVYVAAGTAHPVTDVGAEGCTLLQITDVADAETPPWDTTPVLRL
jgi:quercetin dioxygenase-like cupin family protein